MKRNRREHLPERGSSFVSILVVIGLLGLTTGGAMLAVGDTILETAKGGDESMHASRLGNERNSRSGSYAETGSPEDIGEALVPPSPDDSSSSPNDSDLAPGDAALSPGGGSNAPDDATDDRISPAGSVVSGGAGTDVAAGGTDNDTPAPAGAGTLGTSPWVTLVVDPNDVPFNVENPTGGDWAFDKGLTPEPAADSPTEEDRSFLSALWNVSSNWAWFQVKPKTMEEQIAHDTAAGNVILDAGADLVTGIWNVGKSAAIGTFNYTFDSEYRSEVNTTVVETAEFVVDKTVDGVVYAWEDPAGALDIVGDKVYETGAAIAVAVDGAVQEASDTVDNCTPTECAEFYGRLTGETLLVGGEIVVSVYGGAAVSAIAKGTKVTKVIKVADVIEDVVPPRGTRIGEGGASIAVRHGDDVLKTVKGDFGTTGAWTLNAAQRAEVAEHTVKYQNMLAREIDLVPSAKIDSPGVIRLPFKGGKSFDDLGDAAQTNAKLQMEALAVRAEKVIPPSKTDPLEWADEVEAFVDRNPDNFRFDKNGNVTSWFDPVAVAPPRSALKSEIAAAAAGDVTRVKPGVTTRKPDEIPSNWMDEATQVAPTPVRNPAPIPSNWADEVTRVAPPRTAGGARAPPAGMDDVTRQMPVGGVTRVQPVQAAPKYKQTAQLDRHYAGEDVTGNKVWGGTTVKYLGPADRKPYLVTVRDGKMFGANGKALDTRGVKTAHGQQNAGIYVMDTEGNIYVSMDHRVGEFHHSSLLAGKDVAAAGEIRVVKGEVQFVNRGSGHYQPNTEHLGQMMSELGERGIDVNKVDVGGF